MAVEVIRFQFLHANLKESKVFAVLEHIPRIFEGRLPHLLRQPVGVQLIKFGLDTKVEFFYGSKAKIARAQDIWTAPAKNRIPVFDDYYFEIDPINVLHSDVAPAGTGHTWYRVKSAEVLNVENFTSWIGSDVAEVEGKIFLDNNSWAGSRSHDLSDDSTLVALKDGNALLDPIDESKPRTFSRATWLGYPMLENWGHWLNEGMTRLMILSREPGALNRPIVVSSRIPKKFLNFAALLWPQARFVPLIPGNEIRIGDCFVSPIRGFHTHRAIWSADDELLRLCGEPDSFGALRNLIQQTLLDENSDKSPRGRRTFLARGDAPNRKSGVEGVLLGIARRYGYEVFDQATLRIEEQLSVFTDSSVIFGQTGSSFFLAPFARPGVNVLMVGSDFSHDWAGLNQTIELLTGGVVEMVLGQRPWRHSGFSEKLYHQEFELTHAGIRSVEKWVEKHASVCQGAPNR